ncbi:MAG: PAS domain S-box protein [Chloroflexi bacterium]|nr:PAS domain S-box protein [Chloroflexota bacterium]
MLLDRGGAITYANPEAHRLLGYRAGELDRRPFHATAHHSRPDGTAYPVEDSPINLTLKTGHVSRVSEEVFWRKDGTSFPVEYVCAPLQDQESVAGAVVTFRDDTVRAELGKVLTEGERRFRTVFEGAGIGVALAEKEGRLIESNPALQRMLGMTAAELRQMSFSELISLGARDGDDHDAIRELASGRRSECRLEKRFVRKDGTEIWAGIVITLVRGAGETPRYMIAMAENISERKAAEEAARKLAEEEQLAARLDARNRELQRVHEARGQFLSSVSHELKTPLAAIVAFTEILSRNQTGNLSQRQQDHLKAIHRNCRSLETLINDLLDLSRFDAGRFELSKRLFKANELFDETVKSFAPIFSKKNQNLVTNIEIDGATLEADRDRLAQVLANLLSNASKYSPAGKTITLRAWASDGLMCVEVCDQGIGIKPADVGRLFTPFFRSEDPSARQVPGTGLGLAIVKNIIELHGGQVTVTSAPGEGSKFSFKIPGLLAAA